MQAAVHVELSARCACRSSLIFIQFLHVAMCARPGTREQQVKACRIHDSIEDLVDVSWSDDACFSSFNFAMWSETNRQELVPIPWQFLHCQAQRRIWRTQGPSQERGKAFQDGMTDPTTREGRNNVPSKQSGNASQDCMADPSTRQSRYRVPTRAETEYQT